jgi:hypothetical protein
MEIPGKGPEPGSVLLGPRDPAGRPRLVVTGELDEAVGGALWSLFCVAVGMSPDGLALDLELVTGATSDGIQAVSRCLVAGRRLPDGVEIAVSSAAGRRVLLATLADV